MTTPTLPYSSLKTGQILLQPLTPKLRSIYEHVASRRVEVIVKKPEVPTVSDWLVPYGPDMTPGSSPSSSKFSKLKSLFESKSRVSHDRNPSGCRTEDKYANVAKNQEPESMTRKKVVPYDAVAFTLDDPDRRAYIIYLQHDGDSTAVGVVTLTGKLIPIGLMRDDDIGPRQFKWDVDVFILEEFRRQGVATKAGNIAMESLANADIATIIGHRARLATPGSEEGSNPHYSSGRQVTFEAIISEGNEAGIKLATKLGMKEIGWTMSTTGNGVIRRRHILDWVREVNVDAEYVITRPQWENMRTPAAANTSAVLPAVGRSQSGAFSLEDPPVHGNKRSQHWEPKLVSTDRLFLLPLTTRFRVAWKKVQAQSTGRKVDAEPRLEDAVYSVENRDHRAYAVFRPEDLVGIPSDMVPLEHQQERCLGILKMVGKLCGASQGVAEPLKRRFEWHISVLVIPSHSGNDYAAESLVAALESLKSEDDDVRGWQGLGEDIVVYAEIVGDDKMVLAEEKALKDMDIEVQREIGEEGIQTTRLMVDMLDGKTF